ncbi:uncharacterized protein ACIQIH_004506 isoform 1-T1 [Cyanocitta cristata]
MSSTHPNLKPTMNLHHLYGALDQQVVATFAAFASEKLSNAQGPLKYYLICTEFLPTNQWIDTDLRTIYYHRAAGWQVGAESRLWKKLCGQVSSIPWARAGKHSSRNTHLSHVD